MLKEIFLNFFKDRQKLAFLPANQRPTTTSYFGGSAQSPGPTCSTRNPCYLPPLHSSNTPQPSQTHGNQTQPSAGASISPSFKLSTLPLPPANSPADSPAFSSPTNSPAAYHDCKSVYPVPTPATLPASRLPEPRPNLFKPLLYYGSPLGCHSSSRCTTLASESETPGPPTRSSSNQSSPGPTHRFDPTASRATTSKPHWECSSKPALKSNQFERSMLQASGFPPTGTPAIAITFLIYLLLTTLTPPTKTIEKKTKYLFTSGKKPTDIMLLLLLVIFLFQNSFASQSLDNSDSISPNHLNCSFYDCQLQTISSQWCTDYYEDESNNSTDCEVK